jgi:hypothetical protein
MMKDTLINPLPDIPNGFPIQFIPIIVQSLLVNNEPKALIPVFSGLELLLTPKASLRDEPFFFFFFSHRHL